MKEFFRSMMLGGILLISCSSGGGNRTGTPLPTPPTTGTPTYTDDQLVSMVQQDVLKYFWDLAEPNSKLARERYVVANPSQDAQTVTTGGSGFGLMTILTAINNGYVSRSEAVGRLTTALNFLGNADRFHGAWSHWLNGSTGRVIPFSQLDNGGDLVETAFLVEGLICVREFFKNSSDPAEIALAQKADELWKGVDWDWYRDGDQVLYWHWSPTYNFQIHHAIQGYDETLITYILAASSPTHPIDKSVYVNGWARNGAIASSGSQYGIPLVVNHNGAAGTVGPMFFSQYSFMGLDPIGLSDEFVNYGDATVNHAKIMYQYCVANPKGFSGYGPNNWGLTASYDRNPDGSLGYTAHQPNNDDGVISPTAALADMPYTPDQSMNVLRFIYNQNKANYVGIAGPYDAYSVQYNWVAQAYLAIDQGPIAPMIENHKNQLLWRLFMNAPEIKAGLLKLGFHSTTYGF